MKRYLRHAWVCAWAVVTLGLLLPSPAAAAPEFLRYYKTGLSAAEAGDWAQVEEMMRAAIERRTEEKRRLVFRFYFGGYFPHYYLGMARYHLGDCAGALASWAESEGQGAIVGRDEHAELLRLEDDCEKHGSPSPEGVASASVEGGATGKEKVRTGQHWVEKGADPSRKFLKTVEGVAPADSDLGKAARQGQDAIDVAEAGTEIVDLVLSPSERLEAAINAYFAGNPQGTLEMLEGIDTSDSRARAQVYLFRAAARYRLHLLAGGDDAHLAAARENVGLFQAEQWRKDFPTELFDPRFVNFVRRGGG